MRWAMKNGLSDEERMVEWRLFGGGKREASGSKVGFGSWAGVASWRGEAGVGGPEEEGGAG